MELRGTVLQIPLPCLWNVNLPHQMSLSAYFILYFAMDMDHDWSFKVCIDGRNMNVAFQNACEISVMISSH